MNGFEEPQLPGLLVALIVVALVLAPLSFFALKHSRHAGNRREKEGDIPVTLIQSGQTFDRESRMNQNERNEHDACAHIKSETGAILRMQPPKKKLLMHDLK
jgi:hypothetical protein